MGRAVIRAAPDADLYMVYSTTVQSVTVIGTREELAEEGVRPDEFERADRFGSSSYRRRGYWQSPPLSMTASTRQDSPWYLLERRDFAEYARLMTENQDTEAEALLTPDTEH
ncbi:hypothetical protein ACFZAM_31695 [Streptomyces sp. NPDC008079]|uniref:hypothetical protein n=1 Tax=Streptomyces sp. NPDC008079 TaxID=3364806 RepID=UPI0036E10319